MANRRSSDGFDPTSEKPTILERTIFRPPRAPRPADKPSVGQRVQKAMLKEQEPGKEVVEDPKTLEELERLSKYATDKERLFGLLAAPLAGLLAFVVTTTLVNNDPAAKLANGQPNKLHVDPYIYHLLLLVQMVLALLMLGTAFYRKRMYLGMVSGLFAITMLDMHYWGFAIPYAMFAGYLLVRAVRFQREYKGASGGGTGSRFDRRTSVGRPKGNKRYTPPSASGRY